MKIKNVRNVFILATMLPFLCGASTQNAQAVESDFKKLEMVEVQDTAENRTKYGFLKDVLDDDAKRIDQIAGRKTRIFVGKLDDKKAGGPLDFVYVNGPFYCGINDCKFAGFQGGDGTKEVIDISAAEPVFVQNCDGKISLLFVNGGDSHVARWNYDGKKFAFEKHYDGMTNVPKCK